jgi:uncharacterized membrane protein
MPLWRSREVIQKMAVHPIWLAFLASFMLIVASIVTIVVVARNRRLSTTPQAAPPGTALDILARRFAAGEISAEEYQRSRDLLSGGDKT